MRIAHVTDLHLDDEFSSYYGIDARSRVVTVLDRIVSLGITHTFVTGDCGESGSVPWLRDRLSERGIVAHFALGNHDSVDSFLDTPEYEERLLDDRLAYPVAIDEREFLVLDTSSGFMGSDQADILALWIREKSRVIVFCHHPVLDCGNTVMDRKYPLGDRESVLADMLGIGKPATVFCGHYHNEYESRSGGIVQYATPATSLQLAPGGDILARDGNRFGFRVISLEGDGVLAETEWLDARL